MANTENRRRGRPRLPDNLRKDIHVQARLEDDLAKAVSERLRQTGWSPSELVREALRWYLGLYR